jgi:mannosyltransferase OCH1-like enzyme
MSSACPSFSLCMPANRPPKWGLWSSDDKKWVSLLQKQYNERWRDAQASPPDSCVPRKLHFIWLGSSNKQSTSFTELQQGWATLHPDWEVKLWTDADVAELALENQQAFDSAVNYGEKSDILRYELLERFGGVYADCDFVSLRSLDEIVSKLDFFAGLSNVGAVELNNGLIG